jgi:CheY-like chemotaxis protein
MSLVLAIQPDDAQAAQLTSVCRRIGADLVLAPTAPQALASLGDRIPDVVLSAPLLPASDEAAIAERLRALGDGALHVQALSAPVLGEPIVEPQPRGLLKAFRRQRPASGPSVCDPAVFAGELSGHLLRAVAERAAITGQPIEAPSFDATFDAAFGAAFDKPAASDAAPTDIDLTPLLDGIAEESRPRTRKGQGPRRRKRRRYDDAAYFDPQRSEFAAVVDRFDEFIQQEA